jgi:hypothetical protein
MKNKVTKKEKIDIIETIKNLSNESFIIKRGIEPNTNVNIKTTILLYITFLK